MKIRLDELRRIIRTTLQEGQDKKYGYNDRWRHGRDPSRTRAAGFVDVKIRPERLDSLDVATLEMFAMKHARATVTGRRAASDGWLKGNDRSKQDSAYDDVTDVERQAKAYEEALRSRAAAGDSEARAALKRIAAYWRDSALEDSEHYGRLGEHRSGNNIQRRHRHTKPIKESFDARSADKLADLDRLCKLYDRSSTSNATAARIQEDIEDIITELQRDGMSDDDIVDEVPSSSQFFV